MSNEEKAKRGLSFSRDYNQTYTRTCMPLHSKILVNNGWQLPQYAIIILKYNYCVLLRKTTSKQLVALLHELKVGREATCTHFTNTIIYMYVLGVS